MSGGAYIKEYIYVKYKFELFKNEYSMAENIFKHNLTKALNEDMDVKNKFESITGVRYDDSELNDDNTTSEIIEMSKSYDTYNNSNESNDISSENDHMSECSIESLTESDNSLLNKTKIKSLYREITKLTHPDRVDNYILNKYYILSVDLYNKNDLIGIYDICDILFIKYSIDDEDIDYIKDYISSINSKIKFKKSSYIWTWYLLDVDERINFMKEYIRRVVN